MLYVTLIFIWIGFVILVALRYFTRKADYRKQLQNELLTKKIIPKAHLEINTLIDGLEFKGSRLGYLIITEYNVVYDEVSSLLKSKDTGNFYIAKFSVCFHTKKAKLVTMKIITTRSAKILLSRNRELYISKFGAPERA